MFDAVSSAARTTRRASSSPIDALMFASRYCPAVSGATRSRTLVTATVGRAASTADASTSGAATVSGVVSKTVSLSVGWISSAGVSSAATSIT